MAVDTQEAKRFRQFRKKHIGSQGDAAESLSLTVKHISEIENNHSGVGTDIIRLLVKKYHMNANWWFTGTGFDVTNLEDKRKLIHDISDLKADIEAVLAIVSHHDKQIKYLMKK